MFLNGELAQFGQSIRLLNGRSQVQILYSPISSIEEILYRKKENIIKLISKKDFDELISNGIIGECSVDGNNSATGKHSSGYYDVKKYNKAKRETPDASEKYLKTIAAHIGVAITRHKIYIEDEYVK